MQEIAANLRKPEGENGLKIGEFMSKGNANFYTQLYSNVGWKDGMRILEVGFGAGDHIKDLVSKASGIQYVGVDYSKTMVNTAQKKNLNQSFYHQDVLKLDLPKEEKFDLIVSINTVYFMDDLGLMIRNLKSNLKKGGEVHIGKRPKEDLLKMDQITKYDFNRYSNEEVANSIMEEGLEVIKVTSAKDTAVKREGMETILHSDFIIATKKY